MHGIARRYDATDCVRLQPGIGKLIEVVQKRLSKDDWGPGWKSPMADETATTSAFVRTDGTTWGAEPTSEILPALRMLLDAVVQHVRSVHLMLPMADELALAVDSETRASLEAAAQIWWLLERDLAPRARVARLYGLSRKTSTELEGVLSKTGLLNPGEEGLMPAALDKIYEQELGMAVRRTPERLLFNRTWRVAWTRSCDLMSMHA